MSTSLHSEGPWRRASEAGRWRMCASNKTAVFLLVTLSLSIGCANHPTTRKFEVGDFTAMDVRHFVTLGGPVEAIIDRFGEPTQCTTNRHFPSHVDYRFQNKSASTVLLLWATDGKAEHYMVGTAVGQHVSWWVDNRELEEK
jgi:hypothetical protein